MNFDAAKIIESWGWISVIDNIIDNKVESIISMLRKPSLDWVDEFVYEILHTNNDLDYYILKYKVEVNFEPHNKLCLFLNSASYSETENIFRIFLRDDIDKIKFVESSLIQEIKDFMVHEDTHMQQNQLDSYKQTYCDDPANIKHFTQYHEIAPFARGIAYALSTRTNLCPDEIINAVANNDLILNILPLKEQSALNAYRSIKIATEKPFRKLLKKMYEFFYYRDFHSGGKIELRKWLKENSN